jgi:predicted NUDIX family phosphoesterase
VGQFLDVAYRVLRERREPLTAKAITEIARTSGYLTTKGKTPGQTMKSKLSTDILKKGDTSLFMRSGKAMFALREWKGNISEHVADRFQKALFDEDIIVFPAQILPCYIPTVGLYQGQLDSRGLTGSFRNMRRRDAEDDPSVIQLISVFVLRYQSKFLTYKRTKRLPESRLHGFYSLAFGGHLNPDDIPPLFDLFAPEQSLAWLMRELREEVRLLPGVISSVNYRGLLYDNSRPVSKQHLGIVYEVSVNSSQFEIGERGFLMDAKYESAEAIHARLTEFENWSVILLKELE